MPIRLWQLTFWQCKDIYVFPLFYWNLWKQFLQIINLSLFSYQMKNVAVVKHISYKIWFRLKWKEKKRITSRTCRLNVPSFKMEILALVKKDFLQNHYQFWEIIIREHLYLKRYIFEYILFFHIKIIEKKIILFIINIQT